MTLERSQLIQKRLNDLNKELGSSKLIAVSKATDLQSIEYTFAAGQKVFGENRVPDLEEKAQALKDKSIEWHFIGHLQSNKVSRLLKIPNLKFIHSVDSLKTLENIYKKEHSFLGNSLGLFLQINTSAESEKQGFSLESISEINKAIHFIHDQKESKFYLAGLMTMGKLRTDDFEKDASECFKSLKDLSVKLNKAFDQNLKLSMGMSNDYKIALKEGADYIRVGSSLFE